MAEGRAAGLTTRDSKGFSLLELTVALLMVAVLSVTAYTGYLQFQEDAKKTACQKDLRLIREALRLYNQDHFSTPYPVNDCSALQGRYLTADRPDPWYQPYVVDPFFGRVLSRGPDGVLQTEVVHAAPAPGQPDALAMGPGVNDDLVDVYQPQGVVAAVVPSGARVIQIDESVRISDVRPGATVFGLTTDRESAAMVEGNSIVLLQTFLSNATSTVVTALAPAQPGALENIVPSPDGRRYAGIMAGNAIWIGPLVPGQADNGYQLFTATGGTRLSQPTWGRDSQEIAVGTSGGEIWRIVVGAGAQKSILTSDAASSELVNAPSWSADGKWIAYVTAQSNAIGVMSPTGARPFPPISTGWAGGSVGPVAWSPDSQKIGFVAGAKFYVADPLAPSTRNADMTLAQPLDFSGAKELSWR